MKTEIVNKITHETMYQLQYYKILYLAHKKINKILLIVFTTIIFFFDSISRLFLFKILINLLIEIFL